MYLRFHIYEVSFIGAYIGAANAKKTMWFNQLIELEYVNKTVLYYLAYVCYK